MGSDSDLPVMQPAADILKMFEIPFELTVVSAHRTPLRMVDYAQTAHERGLKVIIAGAGGAAAGADGDVAVLAVAGAGLVAVAFCARGAVEAAAGASALGASAGNFSLYRRTTGVSIVELALLTYSPMPLRRSRRTLLVTPSSLASALTRTLDTFLLSRSGHCARTVVTAGGCSSLSTHRVLISVKPALGSCSRTVGPARGP